MGFWESHGIFGVPMGFWSSHEIFGVPMGFWGSHGILELPWGFWGSCGVPWLLRVSMVSAGAAPTAPPSSSQACTEQSPRQTQQMKD